MTTNSIGQYQFAVLQGVPGVLTDNVQVIQRPNVDGIALRGLGYRGTPFTVRSVTDVDDLDDGRQTLVTYLTLVGADPVQLIINDVDYYSNEGLNVAVLRVAQERLTKATSIVGGLTGNPGAVLYCQWMLHFVDATA